LLAIRAQRFELGEAPSQQALADLALALDWATAWADTGHATETEAEADTPASGVT
jgi:hypothetical protein